MAYPTDLKSRPSLALTTSSVGPSNEPFPDLDQDCGNVFSQAFAKNHEGRSRRSSDSSTLHEFDQTPWEGISPTAGSWVPPKSTRARGRTETSTTVEVETWTREELEASIDEAQQRSRQDTKFDSDPEAEGPAKQKKSLRLDTAMDSLRRSLHNSISKSALEEHEDTDRDIAPPRAASSRRHLSISNFYTGPEDEEIGPPLTPQISTFSSHGVRAPHSPRLSNFSGSTEPLLGRPRSSTGASSKRPPKFVKPPRRVPSDYGTISSPTQIVTTEDASSPTRTRSNTKSSRPSTPRSPLSTRHFMPPLVEDTEVGKQKTCRRCGLERVAWYTEEEFRLHNGTLERKRRLKMAVVAGNLAWMGLIIGAILLATRLGFGAAGWIVLIPVALCMVFNHLTARVWKEKPVCACRKRSEGNAIAEWVSSIPSLGSLLAGNPEKRRKRYYPSLSG